MHNFILHWTEQVRLYNDMKSTIKIADPHKLVLLQNAVHDVDELHAVKVQADQCKVQTGAALDYDQYLRLLKSAATNFDSAKQPKHSVLAKPRSVYTHDVGNTLPDDVDGEGVGNNDSPSFDLDTNIDVIQAYVIQRRPLSN
jgi:hypothetical protein